MRYAPQQDEKSYQEYFRDMIMKMELGWNKEQLIEQFSIQLGSTKRIVPDIYVKKDNNNSWVIEVKRPGHTQTQDDIQQLVSYMKQLETSVGVYLGDELEVYYKNIGDGSEAIRLMSLDFTTQDVIGDAFVRLFDAKNFSIKNIITYKTELDKNTIFNNKVRHLLKELTSSEFQETINDIFINYLIDKGEDIDVIEAVINQIEISITSLTKEEKIEKEQSQDVVSEPARRRRNNGTAQRFAYNLIKQIIEQHSTDSYEQLRTIFNNRKNFIVDINLIGDESRWFMDKNDLITISDGTTIAISNQWGFNGYSKKRMDNLRVIARGQGIDDTIPF